MQRVCILSSSHPLVQLVLVAGSRDASTLLQMGTVLAHPQQSQQQHPPSSHGGAGARWCVYGPGDGRAAGRCLAEPLLKGLRLWDGVAAGALQGRGLHLLFLPYVASVS